MTSVGARRFMPEFSPTWMVFFYFFSAKKSKERRERNTSAADQKGSPKNEGTH
jgi:hypothetical protein